MCIRAVFTLWVAKDPILLQVDNIDSGLAGADSIMKTRRFKYIENFTTKKMKIFR